MMFYCIADEDTVRGFRLAGLAGPGCEHRATSRGSRGGPQRRGQTAASLSSPRESRASIRPQVDAIRLDRDRPLIVADPRAGRAVARAQEPAPIRAGSRGHTALAKGKGRSMATPDHNPPEALREEILADARRSERGHYRARPAGGSSFPCLRPQPRLRKHDKSGWAKRGQRPRAGKN